MSYIGNKPATSFETVQKQISTSNSGTTITLDKAVTSVQDILLTIDAVVQSYDNYSVSGTTLTVGGTLNNNRVEILYVGRTFGSIEPSADSVGSSTLKSNAVTTAKINNDAVTVDKLNLISTGSVPSLEAKGTSGVTEGYIQLNCAENSHGIKLKSPPHSAGASYTLTFPNNDGNANQFLQTNGSGVLSFADAGGDNKPNFFVGTATTENMPDATTTVVPFSSEVIDDGGCFNNTNGTVTLNGLSAPAYSFTPNVAGRYFIATTMQTYHSGGNMSNSIAMLSKNGSQFIGTSQNFGISGQYVNSLTAYGIVDLNGTGDYVQGQVYIDISSGTPQLLGGNNRNTIQGFKLI